MGQEKKSAHILDSLSAGLSCLPIAAMGLEWHVLGYVQSVVANGTLEICSCAAATCATEATLTGTQIYYRLILETLCKAVSTIPSGVSPGPGLKSSLGDDDILPAIICISHS